MSMFGELFRQLFKTPATNKFPVKYAPADTVEALTAVHQGSIQIVPPVELPERFRGKIEYDKEKCIGCKLCVNICPAKAIEFLPEEKKIKIKVSRCCFCSLCNDVCPTNCLTMGKEFLLSNWDKEADSLIVKD